MLWLSTETNQKHIHRKVSDGSSVFLNVEEAPSRFKRSWIVCWYSKISWKCRADFEHDSWHKIWNQLRGFPRLRQVFIQCFCFFSWSCITCDLPNCWAVFVSSENIFSSHFGKPQPTQPPAKFIVKSGSFLRRHAFCRRFPKGKPTSTWKLQSFFHNQRFGRPVGTPKFRMFQCLLEKSQNWGWHELNNILDG